jgi:hypothetical protein
MTTKMPTSPSAGLRKAKDAKFIELKQKAIALKRAGNVQEAIVAMHAMKAMATEVKGLTERGLQDGINGKLESYEAQIVAAFLPKCT